MPVAGSVSSRVSSSSLGDLDLVAEDLAGLRQHGLPELEVLLGQRPRVAALVGVLDPVERVLERLPRVAADEEDVVAHRGDRTGDQPVAYRSATASASSRIASPSFASSSVVVHGGTTCSRL